MNSDSLLPRNAKKALENPKLTTSGRTRLNQQKPFYDLEYIT